MPYGLDTFDGTVTLLRDFGARQVFEGGAGTCLVFPVDRLICDVERFMDGEPMERIGMGICYERNADLEPLRHVSDETRQEIIRRFYEPHHAKLGKMVDAEVSSLGRSLIIDGHTFSAVRRGYEVGERSSSRPQIDIGHDGDAPSVGIANLLVGILGHWYDVMVNEPFSGSLRPLDRIGDDRVASVMIEVRQDLDMELARERIQEAMRAAERMFYGDDTGRDYASHAGIGAGEPFSDAERHRRLDSLAQKYGHLPGFQDVVYGAWDDHGIGSEELTRIELRSLAYS